MKIGSKKRRAVSEIMGTLIMVTITLIAGAAVFGWINGQASNSESAYGQSVANNVNFLKERFVVVTQSFGTSPSGSACSGSPVQCSLMTFWLYNSGQVDFTLYSVRVKSLSSANPLDILFYAGTSAGCATGAQNCGFVAFDPTGTTQICSDTAAWSGLSYQPGFYQSTTSPYTSTVGQGVLSSPFHVTMPDATTCSAGAQYLYDGVAYALTFTGLYGNTYSTTVTVNG